MYMILVFRTQHREAFSRWVAYIDHVLMDNSTEQSIDSALKKKQSFRMAVARLFSQLSKVEEDEGRRVNSRRRKPAPALLAQKRHTNLPLLSLISTYLSRHATACSSSNVPASRQYTACSDFIIVRFCSFSRQYVADHISGSQPMEREREPVGCANRAAATYRLCVGVPGVVRGAGWGSGGGGLDQGARDIEVEIEIKILIWLSSRARSATTLALMMYAVSCSAMTALITFCIVLDCIALELLPSSYCVAREPNQSDLVHERRVSGLKLRIHVFRGIAEVIRSADLASVWK